MAIQTKDDLFQGMRNFGTDERKLEFLESGIKIGMPTDVKIAALLAAAELYHKKKWYTNAAKNYCHSAELAGTFREKMDLYFKGAVMYLISEDYFSTEDNFRKVIVLANGEQKPVFQGKINKLYFEHAEKYEASRHYTKAIKAYHKILNLKIPVQKQVDVYDKLASLYDKIGRPRDAGEMKSHILRVLRDEEEKKEMAEKAKEKAKQAVKNSESFYPI